jgi:hypothetical protein
MATSNKKGTTYNLATSSIVDGNKLWTNRGTLFIRESGEGGVLYLKQDESEVQIGVFRRQPRPDPAGAPSTNGSNLK